MTSHSSQLYKSLNDLLKDKDALTYFIQYMDSKKMVSLVNFWLDIDAFKSSSSYKLVLLERKLNSNHIPDAENTYQSVLAHGITQQPSSVAPCFSEACNSASVNRNFETELNSPASQGVNNNNIVMDHLSTDISQLKMDSSLEDSTELIKNSIKEDAVAIFLKYLSPDSRQRVPVEEHLFNDTVKSICSEDNLVDLNCFDRCQDFVYHIIEQRYYYDFLQSAFYYKHQLEILTGDSLTFCDIIYYSTSLCYFAEFMEMRKKANLLQCYFDLDNFEERFTNKTDTTSNDIIDEDDQKDAIIIYDRYFSLQALKPLNFSDDLRIEIENNICSEHGINVDCFKKAKQLLYDDFNKVHFPLFLTSSIFYQYLAELINTVHTNPYIVNYKRVSSETRNEGKVTTISSSKNTLLAMNENRSTESKKSSENPDSLWMRNQNRGMELGRMDEFGCFITEYDHLPVQSNHLMAGFFGKKSGNTEEQEAIIAAAKILKDINLMTSKNNSNTFS